MTGTWDITGMCAEGDLKSVIGANGTLACEHITSYADFALGGSVTYGDGWVERDTTTRLAFTTSYTPACVATHDGSGPLDASVCSQIEADLLDELANAQGSCGYDGTNCNCTIQGSVTVKERVNLTFTDPWIYESGWGSYQVCVEGDTMTQQAGFLGDLPLQTVFKKR
jgi:hypothetical protein